MTYDIEMQIEELRAEAASCNDLVERREIKAELESLQAELAVIVAEQDGGQEAEPPF